MARLRFNLFVLMTALTLGTGLAACGPTPPPQPDVEAEERRFQMGCQPQDAQGYEKYMPYCGGGNRQ